MNNELVIDVNALNESFRDKHVVRDFSMQVKHGEIYGFLGPNGSGKSTTIRMLYGLLTPCSDTGTCLGNDILRESAQIERQFGYMTQRFVRGRPVVAREPALHCPHVLHEEPQAVGARVSPNAQRDYWAEIYELSRSCISVLVSTHYMDEAERCHRLAYISHGELLASGTAEEVVAQQALTTWSVSGPDLPDLEEQLLHLPGVLQVTPFGNSLHVAGDDAGELEAALAPFREDRRYRWESSEPTVEDVFISLIGHSTDNFQ